eukprot:220318-Prymnesium_polylepis.1
MRRPRGWGGAPPLGHSTGAPAESARPRRTRAQVLERGKDTECAAVRSVPLAVKVEDEGDDAPRAAAAERSA